MNVRDLIELLREQDPDCEVVQATDGKMKCFRSTGEVETMVMTADGSIMNLLELEEVQVEDRPVVAICP